MMRRMCMALFGVIAMTTLMALHAGQEPSPPDKSSGPKLGDLKKKLTVSENIQKRLYEDFEKKLFRLQQQFENGTPEEKARAKVLAKALEQARNSEIGLKYQKLISTLENSKLKNIADIEQALKESQKLADELNRLVKIMRSGNKDGSRAEEIKSLKQQIEELEKIINEQKIAQIWTKDKRASDIELKRKQEKISDKTAKLGKNLGKDGQGGETKDLRSEAKGAGKDAKGKEGKGKDAGKGGEQKTGEGKDGGKDAKGKDNKGGEGKAKAKGSDGKGSKDGKEGKDGKDSKGGEAGKGKDGGKDAKGKDGKGNAKSGDPKDGMGKDSKGGQAKDGMGKDGKKGSPSDAKGGDQKGMGKEGDPSGKKGNPNAKGGEGKKGEPKNGSADAKKGAPKDAKGGMGKADAKGGKKSGMGKAGSPSGKKGNASKGGQGKAKSGSKSGGKGASKSSGSKGSKGSKGSQGGQQSQSKSGGQPGQKGGPTPPSPQQQKIQNAKKQIQDANKYQKSAEKKIDPDNEGAAKDQGDAINKLKQVKKDLEELLRQLREEETERLLAKLQERCQRMLDLQLQVLDGTITLKGKIETHKDKTPDRNDKIESLGLAKIEGEIVKEADLAILMLEAEGSAVAFPEVFQQVREDMINVKKRLTIADAGNVTIAIEKDIVATLKEMIEALKKAQKQQKPMPPKPGQPPPPKPPGDQKLLDLIAELKMIRSMQLRVNRRTKIYGEQYKGEQAADPKIVSEIRQLSDRQDRIFEVTLELYKKNP